MFGLQQKHIDAINACFAQYPQIEQVILYGSRAKGNYKNGSDIDLTIVGDLDYNSLLKLENQLDDLLLPYKMDLSLKHKITNPDLLNHIERVGKVFYEKAIEKVLSKPDAAYGKPSEWKTYKLGEIATFISRGVTPSYSEDGVVVINQKCIRDGKVSFEQARFTNPILKKITNDKYLQSFDILINSTGQGTLGRVGQVKKITQSTTVDSHVTIVRPSNKVNPIYLGYSLKSKQTLIESLAEGSTGQTELARQKVAELEITIPDLPTQKEIAQILSSLDDKIALNLQMNQTLEAMAQAIFKEWFVNLNFPKSLNLDSFDLPDLHDLKNQDNQENPKNHSSDNGLPKGWRMGNVLEIATLLSGGTPKTSEPDYWDGEINWISAKDITSSNNQFIIETEKTITELGIRKSAAKLLPIYTTIISARGTVGNFCILPKEMAISQSNYGLKSHSDFDFFLFLLVKNMILMMKAFAYGAVFDTITTKTFEAMEITIPENQVIEEFENFIKPIYSKILTNQLQIQSLTQTRDTLLPKLMSGQIKL